MTQNNPQELHITRVLNAPLERVWRAWTETSELQKWWGPYGVTNPTCEWDVSVGGAIYIVMLAGDELGELKGQEWPMRGTFTEIVPREKLVFTSAALADGKPILESLCTVTFESQGQGGQTKFTLHVQVTKTTPEAAGALAGMEAGWGQSIDKLAEQVR